MEVVVQNKSTIALYDVDNEIIHYKFSGLFNEPLIKAALGAVAAFSEQNKITGIHADLTELNGTFTSLNDYLIKEYFPALIAQGLVCNSIVVPNDIFTQFAAGSLVQKMGGFTIQTFGNLEEGYKWVLENVNAKIAKRAG